MLDIAFFRYDIVKFSDDTYAVRRRAAFFGPSEYRDRDLNDKMWWSHKSKFHKINSFAVAYGLYQYEIKNQQFLISSVCAIAREFSPTFLRRDFRVLRTPVDMAQEMLASGSQDPQITHNS
jgi:hypothetical protein